MNFSIMIHSFEIDEMKKSIFMNSGPASPAGDATDVANKCVGPNKSLQTFVLLCVGMVGNGALAQSDTSPFIDAIPVGSAWQNVTANEGSPLRIDYQAVAYSGGGTANGRTVVLGGGHNNGMNDAVAFLDWRNFETVGWTEELISTAGHIGVSDEDYREIGQYLNANYNNATPGGIFDSRGSVALSRHTYDQVVVRSDHFYIFSGVLPFDHAGQPSPPEAAGLQGSTRNC